MRLCDYTCGTQLDQIRSARPSDACSARQLRPDSFTQCEVAVTDDAGDGWSCDLVAAFRGYGDELDIAH